MLDVRGRIFCLIFLSVLCHLSSGICLAYAIEFQIPLACDIGKNCFIQNYVDEDPTPDYHDYKCGAMTYDHHTGTDFRLPDYVAMRAGIDVLAAADGRVERLRDGMPDINVRQIDGAVLKEKNIECGNGVAISHGGSWETQYCHMKKGSIAVKPGQIVKAGDKIGQVGLSGATEFPHMHFEVRNNGKVIDPFTGSEIGRRACDVNAGLENSLWNAAAREKLEYNPTALLSAGFATDEPKEEATLQGEYRAEKFPADAKALVFWAYMMGARKNDELVMQLTAPDGHVMLTKQAVFPRNRAVQFFYIESKPLTNYWLSGTYTGEVVMIRKSETGRKVIFDEKRKIVIEG